MPHLGTTRTGFLQMIQDLQLVFDYIAEVLGEFLVYNIKCMINSISNFLSHKSVL